MKGWPPQTIKAVVFDVGGVLILHSDNASRELIEKHGLRPETFARITRSSLESHPRSITELAMIGQVSRAEGSVHLKWKSQNQTNSSLLAR